MARLWVDAVDRHGGDATLVHLLISASAATRISPSGDLNNFQIADDGESGGEPRLYELPGDRVEDIRCSADYSATIRRWTRTASACRESAPAAATG